MISPAIQATLNAVGVVRNLAHAVLYGPEKYQGLAVKNPYFLQEIIHIVAFLTELVYSSSTGKLLKASAENFRVEIGIPFPLTATPYDANLFAYYCPSCWYKSLWKIASNVLYKLDISEDYSDLVLVQMNDVFSMQAFVDAGFRGDILKSLNFVRKYIQAVSLADIASSDGHRISHQAFEALASNVLRDDTDCPKTVPVLPAAFIALWKKAITKTFINFNSGIPKRTNQGAYLGDCTDPLVREKLQ